MLDELSDDGEVGSLQICMKFSIVESEKKNILT